MGRNATERIVPHLSHRLCLRDRKKTESERSIRGIFLRFLRYFDNGKTNMEGVLRLFDMA